MHAKPGTAGEVTQGKATTLSCDNETASRRLNLATPLCHTALIQCAHPARVHINIQICSQMVFDYVADMRTRVKFGQ